MFITAGSTNVTLYVYFVDDDGGTAPGEPTTGLLFSDIETGGSASYCRQGEARADFTLVTQTAAGAHTDGGFVLVDDTNMPGLYRVDLPDAAFASGADFVTVQLVAASGNNTIMRPLLVMLPDFDLQNGTPTVNATQIGSQTASASGTVTFPAATLASTTNITAGTMTTTTNLTTNNDKTGYTLSAAGVDAIWDETMAGHTTSDTAGEVMNDWQDGGRLDAILDARMAEASINTTGGAVDTVTTVTTTTTNSDMRGTDSAALAADYTAARAGYLDNLNIGENVAGTSEVGHLVSVSGTADSGGTSTVVDAVRTELDDHWNGSIIVFGSGGSANNVGAARIITDFDAASDTITFEPVVLTGITTETYTIIPAARVDLLAATQTSIDAIETDTNSLNDTKVPNTLNTTASGNIGIDWANVENPGSAVDLAATDIQLCDTTTTNSDMRGTDSTALASVCTEARLSELDEATAGKMANQVDIIEVDTTSLNDTKIPDTLSLANINAEVLDVVNTDTMTLPGQEAPPLAPTMREALGWVYKFKRNRLAQTATQLSLYADDESTIDAKATVSDDATTAIRQEFVSGP